MRRILCPYCGKPADHVRNQWGVKYECVPCDARVGCRRGTDIPLGTLANAELRQWRIRAHEAFDRLWQQYEISRSRAYRWLSEQMQIKPHQCHIGQFNIEQCRMAVQIAKDHHHYLQEAAHGIALRTHPRGRRRHRPSR